MRKLLVLIPIALVGGFAIHQVASGQEFDLDEPDLALDLHCQSDAPEAISHELAPSIEALAAVEALPQVLAHVSAVPEVTVHIPHHTIEEVERLANEIRVHARASAEVNVEAAIEEAMLALEEAFSDREFEIEEALEEFGISASFLAELAASIEASLAVTVDGDETVRVRIPKRNRH